MGKNKKKKTKVKTISLEEFSDSYKPDTPSSVLPTTSMGIVNEPENVDNYSNRRTPISKDSTFFGNMDGNGDGGEVDWSRGADMSTSAPNDQQEDESSDWRQNSESTGPTSAPQKSSAELESNWRQDSESTGPTSAPKKSSAELESNWRQNSERIEPTSAPKKSSDELESNWRQNLERIEPTSAPKKSSAELESNWRSNSTPNKSREYVTPDKYNWRDNIKPTRCR